MDQNSVSTQAQLKLADAIRKLAEHAERNGIELDMDVQVLGTIGRNKLFCHRVNHISGQCGRAKEASGKG